MSEDTYKEELETYKRLYREVLAELTNAKNLLYYIKLGEFDRLIEYRKEREKARLLSLQYKREAGRIVTEEDTRIPQVEIPPFEFPQQKT